MKPTGLRRAWKGKEKTDRKGSRSASVFHQQQHFPDSSAGAVLAAD